MDTNELVSFLHWYERTREATNRIIAVIPPDKLDWTYQAGKFTVGDLVRHIAAIERNLFAEKAAGRPIAYTGCGKELADGYENILAYFHEMHRRSMEIFRSLGEEDLSKKILSVTGKPVAMGSFLRALLVHEVHHRGVLCVYLGMLGVTVPPILGATEAEVIAAAGSEPS